MAEMVLVIWAALFTGFVIVEIAGHRRVKRSDAGAWVGLSVEPDVYCSVAAVSVRDRVLGIIRVEDFRKLGERDPSAVYVGSIMAPAHAFQPGARVR
jgi:hypothetical protein